MKPQLKRFLLPASQRFCALRFKTPDPRPHPGAVAMASPSPLNGERDGVRGEMVQKPRCTSETSQQFIPILIALVVLLLIPDTSFAQAGGGPVFQTQPANQDVLAGATATFSATAFGSPTPAYQWFHAGVGPVLQATNPTLILKSVDLPDAGAYFVRVTNIFGTNRSIDAFLTVTQVDFGDAPAPYPTTLAQDGARHIIVPTMYLGAGVSFEPDGQPDANASSDTFDDGIKFLTALARGKPCTVRVVASVKGLLDGWIDFNANGSWLDPGEQIFTSVQLSAGTNLLTFTVPTTTPASAVTTFARFRFSSRGNLRPNGLALDGEVEDYQVQLFPDAADLCLSATVSPDPLPPTSTAQCAVLVTNTGPSPAVNVVFTDTFSGVDVTIPAGTANCTLQGNQLICQLGNLAAGEARTVAFTFRPRQPSMITNALTVVSDTPDPRPFNNRTAIVMRAASPLVITMQPQDVKVALGGNATFSVSAQGLGALSYQWFSNGVAIAGATESTLTLLKVQDSAIIQVQVADAIGGVGIGPAALDVIKPPVIVTPPIVITPTPTNNPIPFDVKADGTAPLQYQWRLNGENIPGATNEQYFITAATRPDGGAYTVAIANDAGVTVSDPVLVTFPDFNKFAGSDSFAQAPLLLSPAGNDQLQGIIQSDNIGATKEPGELNHAGQPGGASVWYLWRAPISGIATFETLGSTFDTLLAAYTGTSISNLSELASDDDHAGFFRSLVQFRVLQGQIYDIVVDGFAGHQGIFVLGWRLEQTDQLIPVITEHPHGRTVPPGADLTLSVTATDASPAPQLLYQWIFNGAPIQGANAPTFTITNITRKRVGTYAVRVASAPVTSARFVESHPAIVEIGSSPNIQSQDKIEDTLFDGASLGGPSARRTKSLGGGPPFVSVAFGIPGSQIMNNTNSTADLDCFRIGTATRWLGIHVTNDPAAAGSVLRVDTAGSAIMTELAVYQFISLSCLQSVPCMHSHITGCDTNDAGGGGYSMVEFFPALGGDYLVFADGLNGAQGIIQMNWQLGDPPMLDPPLGCTQVVPAGTNVTINAGVTNNPNPPPTYQWSWFGIPMAGHTNSSITFGSIRSSNAGPYSVVISNIFGVVTNNCCLVVNPPLLRYQPNLTNSPTMFNISAAMLPGVLQAATSLSAVSWQSLVTNLTTNCNCQLAVPMQDTNGAPLPPRFYRARTP